MDGYTVKDAAIVLGIPERRVWELLARGVLAGAREGPDGMMVFLQPRGAPASVTQQDATPGAADSAGQRANGNGGSHEPSPFRELLTEFRNLTERYGQALLALGEARGEVASLRGRVELLEARMDLRLPGTQPASTVAWEIPDSVPEEASAQATFEADVAEPDEPPPVDLEQMIAGEDEPAAASMIDLDEEAAFAEAMAGFEEPIGDDEAAEMVASVAMEADAFEPEPSDAARFGPDAGLPEPDLPEAMPAAMLPDEMGADEESAEPPRRRMRGGHTATAAFAAALARADDPTIAELPGAEETAAALAALQRDIDATRADEVEPEATAEPMVDFQPEAAAEPAIDLQPEAAAEPEPEGVKTSALMGDAPQEAAAPDTDHEEPADARIEPDSQEAAEAQPAAPAPVPSYYSTDVVEPDWFADGDFSWLEAAQAEAARVQAEQPNASDTSSERTQDAAMDTRDTPAVGDDEGMRPVAMNVGTGPSGVAAELAFGEHPSMDASRPDLGHEGFEPTAESQAIAEDEARAAIQDAFSEAPAASADEPVRLAAPALATATAVAEPESPPQAIEEPEAPAELEAPEEPPEVENIQEAFEPSVEQIDDDEAAIHDSEPETEAGAETSQRPIEAEAIQEAFEQTTTAYEPPAAELQPVVEPPATDLPEPEAPADEAVWNESDDTPRAIDEAPASIMAATEPDAWRGPEEFIAPSTPAAVMGIASPPLAGEPVTPATGEEALMWLGDEFEEAGLEVAAQGWRSPDAAPVTQPTSPVLELSDAELAQLAEDEGWDLEEVEAIRRLLGRPSDAAGLEPVVEAPPATQPAAPASLEDSPEAKAGGSSFGITGGQGPAHDPEWLHGRSGAAADAYRRLRKLFPS